MVIWGEQSKELKRATLDKVNLRRLQLMLWDNRLTPKHVKLTRRSRRRMRGKGGVYQYPPKLVELYKEALGRFWQKG